ncbi:MAG: C2H2-type zinc finger protein, partial [Promethearchaeota archaeon]
MRWFKLKYECPYCDKTFNSKGWLTRHLNAKHP